MQFPHLIQGITCLPIDKIAETKILDVTTVVTPSNEKTVENKGVFNTVESNTVRRECSAPINEELVSDVNTARQKAVVNAVRTNRVNAVKASACWVWRPGNPETKLEDLVRLNNPKDEKRAGAELTQQNDKSQYKNFGLCQKLLPNIYAKEDKIGLGPTRRYQGNSRQQAIYRQIHLKVKAIRIITSLNQSARYYKKLIIEKTAALNVTSRKERFKLLPFIAENLKAATSGKVGLMGQTKADDAFRMFTPGTQIMAWDFQDDETTSKVLLKKGVVSQKDEEAKRKEPEPESTWKLFTDRASSSDGSRACLILDSPEGKVSCLWPL
ncbi:hypothetical protein Tco_1066144 [Tanacetum coccineum]